MFKSCFSKVFTSCLSCFVYDKQRFNIVGFYGFLSKYVFLCFFTTFFFFFFFQSLPVFTYHPSLFRFLQSLQKETTFTSEIYGPSSCVSRSSRLQVFYNRYIFRKIYNKTRVPGSLFNKVTGHQPVTVLKKRLQNKVFPWEFCKIFKSNFL